NPLRRCLSVIEVAPAILVNPCCGCDKSSLHSGVITGVVFAADFINLESLSELFKRGVSICKGHYASFLFRLWGPTTLGSVARSFNLFGSSFGSRAFLARLVAEAISLGRQDLATLGLPEESGPGVAFL